MVYGDKPFSYESSGKKRVPEADETMNAAVESGDCARARAVFDRVFWRNEKLVPQWEHLKTALLRDDKPMMKLLVTWGARAPENAAQLNGISPEKFSSYARILRGYGLDVTVVEEAAAVLPPPALVPEAREQPEIGQRIAGDGIYLGQYKPKDRKGNSLGKVFNVFAAPQDLPDTMLYIDAVKHIAKLKGWNGFDGTNYATDKKIYAALKDGSYNGGWIIPTRDILSGNDVDGKSTTPDNLYAHKDKGALKGTFETATPYGFSYPEWYWSSTEDRVNPSGVHMVRFSDGNERWHPKDYCRMSCRPVRLVEVPRP